MPPGAAFPLAGAHELPVCRAVNMTLANMDEDNRSSLLDMPLQSELGVGKAVLLASSLLILVTPNAPDVGCEQENAIWQQRSKVEAPSVLVGQTLSLSFDT